MSDARAWTLAGLLLCFAPTATAAQEAQAISGDLATGDAAWERRAEGIDGAAARPGPASEAIAAYQRAVDADPDDLSARIKLLRAIHFLGEYATAEKRDKIAVFERGREIAEAGIDRLTADFAGEARPRWDDEEARRALVEHLGLEDQPDAVGIYLWAANHWALWGRYRGPLPAARQGVAGKIRDYAHVVLALDRSYDRAGGHRVLGRLHHEAPRVPFVTGWIDRDNAVAQLTLAVEEAPDDLLNRLYWIESVLEHHPAWRQRAIDSLRELAAREPDPAFLVEELDVLLDARALLDEIDD